MGSSPDKPQYQAPKYTELSLPELRTALSKFIDQEQDFDGLQNAITSSATKRMDALETLQPGYKAGLSQAQQVADSLAQGNVPADVAQKISQSAAFKGLMTGMTGGQRSTVEARDFGLTSLDLQGRGLAAQQALRAEANAQMPLQAMNLAFTPQAIRAEDVTLAEYNNKIKNNQAQANADIYNRQQDANYAYDQKYGGSPWGSIGGGILGTGLGIAAAPFTGGMSIPMGLAMGSSIGSAINGGGQSVGMASMLSGVGGMGMQGFAAAARGGFQFPNFWDNSGASSARNSIQGSGYYANPARVGLRPFDTP
jgi:hypothetical protein